MISITYFKRPLAQSRGLKIVQIEKKICLRLLREGAMECDRFASLNRLPISAGTGSLSHLDSQ